MYTSQCHGVEARRRRLPDRAQKARRLQTWAHATLHVRAAGRATAKKSDALERGVSQGKLAILLKIVVLSSDPTQ